MDEQCFHNVFIQVPLKQTLRRGLRKKTLLGRWSQRILEGEWRSQRRKAANKVFSINQVTTVCTWGLILLWAMGARAEYTSELFLLRCEQAGVIVQWFQSPIDGGLLQESINSSAFSACHTGSKVSSKSQGRLQEKQGCSWTSSSYATVDSAGEFGWDTTSIYYT